MTRTNSIVLVLAAFAALLLGVASVNAGSRTGGDQFEYAEFTIVGDTAYLATATEQIRFDPSNRRGPQSTSDNGRVAHGENIRIIRMNELGAQGWELVTSTAVRDGVTYLLRRRL